MVALRQVWEKDTTVHLSRKNTLEKHLNTLRSERTTATRKSLSSNLSEEAIGDVIGEIDNDIANVVREIEELSSIEKDFVEFVDCCLTTIENMRSIF